MKSLILHNGQLKTADMSQLLADDKDYPERAVYTSIRTYEGRPFHLDEHVLRLRDSARRLGFELLWPLESIRLMIQSLIAAAPHDPQFLKVVVTPQNLVAISRQLCIDHQQLRQGVSVTTTAYERPHVHAKAIPHPELIAAYEQAAEQGHHDVLLLNGQGLFTEGSRSNLLWIMDGTLYWSDQALAGITQAAVKRLLEVSDLDLQLSCRPGLDQEQLADVEELFLTQTSRGIVPIIRVDDLTVGDESPGPMTRALQHLFFHSLFQSS